MCHSTVVKSPRIFGVIFVPKLEEVRVPFLSFLTLETRIRIAKDNTAVNCIFV